MVLWYYLHTSQEAHKPTCMIHGTESAICTCAEYVVCPRLIFSLFTVYFGQSLWASRSELVLAIVPKWHRVSVSFVNFAYLFFAFFWIILSLGKIFSLHPRSKCNIFSEESSCIIPGLIYLHTSAVISKLEANVLRKIHAWVEVSKGRFGTSLS